jgi:hypothetical protein
LGAKCLEMIGEISLDEMSVDEMTIDKMALDEMFERNVCRQNDV